MKATALAVSDRRTATVGRMSVDLPWNWNAHEVWLARIKPPRARAARSATRERFTPQCPGTAPRD